MISDNILKRMSPADRSKLGKAGVTNEEAQEAFAVTSERSLQRLIHNELLRREIPHSWSRTDRRTTTTIGWPDFTFPMMGFFLFIEVKFEKGKLSDEQERLIKKLRRNGAIGIVATDFQSAKEFLDRYTAPKF